jgi:hypothetical protein
MTPAQALNALGACGERLAFSNYKTMGRAYNHIRNQIVTDRFASDEQRKRACSNFYWLMNALNGDDVRSVACGVSCASCVGDGRLPIRIAAEMLPWDIIKDAVYDAVGVYRG